MKTRGAKAEQLVPARWSRAEGRAVLDDWQRSGESLAAFARRRGVQEQRLRYWVARRAEERGAGPPRFHRVHLTDAVRPREDDWIEIVVEAGHVVRVPPGFGAADLQRVLAVLEAPPTC